MDIIQREGKYPLPPGASEILGVEFSGVIGEVGRSVNEWKEGDEVIGLVTGVKFPLFSFRSQLISCRAHTQNMLSHRVVISGINHRL